MIRVKFFSEPLLLLIIFGLFFLTQILLARINGEHLLNVEKAGKTEILSSTRFMDEETGHFDDEYVITEPDRERFASPNFLRWDEHTSEFQLTKIAGCWGCYGLYK